MSDSDNSKRKSKGGKSPGFWFFTGDWLKDPELRFCSIFARGLLVDLLCFMFESKERGYLIWPDGSPRSNEDIADAVSGGDRSDKVKAIEELERKGVLSRDSRGVLYSRRMARLGEISQMRADAGSKGGTKREQKPSKNVANDEQKPGVTVSDSVSASDPLVTTHTHPLDDPNGLIGKDVIVPDNIREWFIKWLDWRWQDSGKKPPATLQETWVYELISRGEAKAINDLRFSITKQAKNLLHSENDFDKVAKAKIDGATKPVGRESAADKTRKMIEDMRNGLI